MLRSIRGCEMDKKGVMGGCAEMLAFRLNKCCISDALLE